MRHLELAVFRILYRQAEDAGIKNGHYTTDLLMEIVVDPRITDVDLDLTSYKKLIGKEEWGALLEKHAH